MNFSVLFITTALLLNGGLAAALPVAGAQKLQQTPRQLPGATSTAPVDARQTGASLPARIPVTAASNIVCRDLRDPEGDDAGSIEYLLIDLPSGRITFAMIGSGGSLDIGTDDVAVPWAALQVPNDPNAAFGIGLSVAQIAEAPRIGPADLRRLTMAEPRQAIYRFWRDHAPQPTGDAGGGRPGTAIVIARPGASGYRSLLIGAAGNALLCPAASADTRGLENVDVHDQQGILLGDIDQVMIDVGRGQAAYVLMSRGGLLGIDQEWLPVLLQAMTFVPWRDGFRLTVDAAALKTAPDLQANAALLPTSVGRGQLASLYRRFGLAPYWQPPSALPGSAKGATGGALSSAATRD